MKCILVLGDQLFPISEELLQWRSQSTVFMAEDREALKKRAMKIFISKGAKGKETKRKKKR